MALSEHQQTVQDLKQPDPFFEAIGEAREYYKSNQSKVIAIVVGSVALLAGVVGANQYWTAQGERAATDFAAAVSSLEFDTPSAAEVSLGHIQNLSNAGPYKALASLYRGDIAAADGRNEEAIVAYETFLPSAPTAYAKQIGLMGKAAALESAGKAAESAAALDLAAAIDGPYRKAALTDRARLAEDAGDKAVAVANLQKLLEIEGSGPAASEIEKRIEALK